MGLRDRLNPWNDKQVKQYLRSHSNGSSAKARVYLPGLFVFNRLQLEKLMAR